MEASNCEVKTYHNEKDWEPAVQTFALQLSESKYFTSELDMEQTPFTVT